MMTFASGDGVRVDEQVDDTDKSTRRGIVKREETEKSYLRVGEIKKRKKKRIKKSRRKCNKGKEEIKASIGGGGFSSMCG